MDKEKILRWGRTANMVVVVMFSPIMLFVSLYALGDIVGRSDFFSPLVMMMVGYSLALAFGLLAFKRNLLLVISLLGWLLFMIGNHIDRSAAQNENKSICMEMRRDPNCTEDESGGMICRGGKWSGASSFCRGIPK